MDGRRNVGAPAVPHAFTGGGGESGRVRVAVCHVIAYEVEYTPMGTYCLVDEWLTM